MITKSNLYDYYTDITVHFISERIEDTLEFTSDRNYNLKGELTLYRQLAYSGCRKIK